jgi:organic hydroperoxide reductase OsmC/OhrA
MAANAHDYAIDLTWEGNLGNGTADYAAYGRQWRAVAPGRPAIVGSADPTFRGDRRLVNPEDMLVASLSSCHMLSYLALCARRRLRVLDYRDRATGRMRTDRDGGGRFEEVVLHPAVTIAEGDDVELARSLHEPAHRGCFIAASVSFEVRVEPRVAAGHAPAPPPRRKDLAVQLPDRPGALAELGERLGAAGVSLEGGGGFTVAGHSVVHFLVGDADAAIAALRAAGIAVLGVRDVLEVRLDQGTPGQLGRLARALADAGVNIDCVYTDHDHRLVLCVDDAVAGARVVAAWST